MFSVVRNLRRYLKICSDSAMPYYAVRNGRNPGVYLSWDECKAQVDKFNKARYKKFATEQEALDFVQNRNNEAPVSSPPVFKDRSYNRKPTNGGRGLSQKSLLSLKGSLKQASQSLEQARTFMSQAENVLNSRSKRTHTESSDQDSDCSTKRKKSSTSSPSTNTYKPGAAIVYTDGACTNNGRGEARAGIGVYWGQNHPRNLSEKLHGRQTNNRAEIYAATRAVQQAKNSGIKDLVIRTDSQFLINCMTSWIHKWKTNDWVSSSGKPVINREELEELDSELQYGVNVKWEHVRGHVGIEGNEAADRLANAGASKPY